MPCSGIRVPINRTRHLLLSALYSLGLNASSFVVKGMSCIFGKGMLNRFSIYSLFSGVSTIILPLECNARLSMRKSSLASSPFLEISLRSITMVS